MIWEGEEKEEREGLLVGFGFGVKEGWKREWLESEKTSQLGWEESISIIVGEREILDAER